MAFIHTETKFDRTLSLLKKQFSKHKEILVVYLYGSVARGDFSERHSDLDLFVVINKDNLPENLKKKLNSVLVPLGLEFGVKVHIEYQGLKISKEDQTLIAKMIEEGRIIYSSGVFSFSNHQLGLRQFIIYSYSLKDSKSKTMFSKTLHGRTSWYYNGKKKIVKKYEGIADHDEIIVLGNGYMMVSKNRQKDIETFFNMFGAVYAIERIVYG